MKTRSVYWMRRLVSARSWIAAAWVGSALGCSLSDTNVGSLADESSTGSGVGPTSGASDPGDDSSGGPATGDSGTTAVSPPGPESCDNPQPIPFSGSGAPSGYVLCDNGLVLRESAVACEATAPGGAACTIPDQPCAADADCTERAYGRCIIQEDYPEEPTCGCVYGCETDDDCEGGICLCGPIWSGPQDVVFGDPASCTVPACESEDDCGGNLCALAKDVSGCGYDPAMTCRSGSDPCAVDADCPLLGENCVAQQGVWECFGVGCDG